MPTTRSPRASSASTTWLPMKPAAPVTRTFLCMISPSRRRGPRLRLAPGGPGRLATDGVVVEATTRHLTGVEAVAAVDQHRVPHQRARSTPVELRVLLPLGDDGGGIGPLQALVGIGSQLDLRRQERCGPVDRAGIVSGHLTSLL